MSLKSLVKKFRARIGASHGVKHSVATLVGGTAFAQAITLLAIPVLTRLYTPTEFSTLAVYSSLLAILSVSACLRLEIAIPLPEADEDAANLLGLALFSSAGFALILILGISISPDLIIKILGSHEIRPYLWMVPLGVWIASSFAAIQYWSTRKKKFPLIARTRMIQALGGVTTQVGMGLGGAGSFGLLFGQMINTGAGLFGLSKAALHENRNTLHAVSWQGMRSILKKNSHFPKYSTLEALANTCGSQLPVIIIAATAGPEAGFLALAMRVMAAPMGLIGGSVAQVYLAHAPQELRAGNLGPFTSKIIAGLAKAGVGPLIFVGITAPPLSEFFFGDGWRRAGELVAWMTPWFALQFLTSPVSMVMHITGRQKLMLTLTICGLMIRVGAVIFASASEASIISECYAISGAFFYLICLAIFSAFAGVSTRKLLEIALQATPSILTWSALGVIATLITQRL